MTRRNVAATIAECVAYGALLGLFVMLTVVWVTR